MVYDQPVFFDCMRFLEQSISDTLFRKGSLFKFVFQDTRDNWFCLRYDDSERVQPVLLSHGIWNYYEQVFKAQNDDTFVSYDFFYTPQKDELKQMMSSFYDSLKVCSDCTHIDQEFSNVNPDFNIL